MFVTKAGAAAETVLDRVAFLGKPFFLVHDHWTHQQMLTSFTVPPDLRLAGFEPRWRGYECGLLDHYCKSRHQHDDCSDGSRRPGNDNDDDNEKNVGSR